MTKTFKEIVRLQEFKINLKQLLKKYISLEDDLKIFEQAQLNAYHYLQQDNKGIIRISNLGIVYPEIYKVTKFACRSIPKTGVKSGIRIIYAFFPQEECVELIEIYHKNERENHNENLIIQLYLKTESNQNIKASFSK